MFSKEIRDCLEELKNYHGAVSLKASFEDEGIYDDDLTDLVLLSGCTNLDVAVKIGGAEANSDIDRCLRRGVTDIVAPMIETTFAASKFINAASVRSLALDAKNLGLHINLETKTAAQNTNEILKDHATNLRGVVVGRSDLSKSMGLQKKDVDSYEVMDTVKGILFAAKATGLITTMGGTISSNSADHIVNLFNDGLLNRYETRAVVFRLYSKASRQSLLAAIDCALRYEQLLLGTRSVYHTVRAHGLSQRVMSIESRKNV